MVETIGMKGRAFPSSSIPFKINSFIGMSILIPFVLGKAFGAQIEDIELLLDEEVATWIFWAGVSLSTVVLTSVAGAGLSETPSWLLSKYRLKKAERVLNTIADTNHGHSDIQVSLLKVKNGVVCEESSDGDDHDEADENLKSSDEPKEIIPISVRKDGAMMYPPIKISFGMFAEPVHLEMRMYSWVKIFHYQTIYNSLTIAYLLILAVFLEIVVSARYDLHWQRNYLSWMIEIAGIVFVMISENKLGRRNLTIILLLLVAIPMIFAHQIVDTSDTILADDQKRLYQRVFISALTFSTAAFLSLLLWFVMYAFPTSVRSTALMLSSGLFGVVHLVAPIVIQFFFSSGDDQARTPFFWLGIFAFIGALLVYYLPETINRPMPKTMEDLY